MPSMCSPETFRDYTDDASRMVLAGGEFTGINTENSMLIIDHGSEFGAHKIHDDGRWNSEFKDHLKKHGIKPKGFQAKNAFGSLFRNRPQIVWVVKIYE